MRFKKEDVDNEKRRETSGRHPHRRPSITTVVFDDTGPLYRVWT